MLKRITNKLARAIKNTAIQSFNRIACVTQNPTTELPNTAHIYLTFDDGPNSAYTLQLAEILESRGHRATFFLVGNRVSANPGIVSRLINSGHAVGSHSHDHMRQWEISGTAIIKDYSVGHETLEEAVGRKVSLFRPPHGFTDWRSEVFVKMNRLKLVLWNSDSFDWKEDASVESILTNVEETLTAGNILLFHDAILDNPKATNRDHTLAAIKIILDRLEEKGLVSAGIPA